LFSVRLRLSPLRSLRLVSLLRLISLNWLPVRSVRLGKLEKTVWIIWISWVLLGDDDVDVLMLEVAVCSTEEIPNGHAAPGKGVEAL
jgi:hypothetical protein